MSKVILVIGIICLMVLNGCVEEEEEKELTERELKVIELFGDFEKFDRDCSYYGSYVSDVDSNGNCFSEREQQDCLFGKLGESTDGLFYSEIVLKNDICYMTFDVNTVEMEKCRAKVPTLSDLKKTCIQIVKGNSKCCEVFLV